MSKQKTNADEFSRAGDSHRDDSGERVQTVTVKSQNRNNDDVLGIAVCRLVKSAKAADRNQRLRDVCDTDSTLKAVYATLFDIDGETKEELDIVGWWDDLLFIVAVDIDSRQADSSQCIRLIEGAIAPFSPKVLVVADEESLDLTAEDWQQLGFRRIAGSSFVFRDPACGLRPKVLRDNVLRTFSIRSELGFRCYAGQFAVLAGSPDEREARVLEIKEQVLAICGRHDGILVDEEVQYYADSGDDGKQPEIERIETLYLDFEFPDRRAARLAGSQVLEEFEVYDVSQYDPKAPEGLTPHFVIREDQNANTIERIQCHIADVCKRLDAEVLNIKRSERGSRFESLRYEVLFESESDVVAAITELRKVWNFNQLSFGWCFMRRRFPEETRHGRDTEQKYQDDE